MRVGLFIPCYVDQCFPHVGRAAVQILRRVGVECHFDPRQTCCGQPALNCGYRAEAAAVAEHFVRVFGQYETVVCPGGSCVAMVRHHFHDLLGRDEPITTRVHELCQFLVEVLGIDDLGAKLPGRAAVHVPCHMLRHLDGPRPVQRLLANVRGLVTVPLPSDSWCCGFGGAFSVAFPELSAAMAKQKLDQMHEHALDYLISPESSCLMQLAGLCRRLQRPIRPLHILEVLSGWNP